MALKPLIPPSNVWGWTRVIQVLATIFTMGIVGFMPGSNDLLRNILLIAIPIVLLLIAGTKQQGIIHKYEETIHEYQDKLKDKVNYKEIRDHLSLFVDEATELLQKIHNEELPPPRKEYEDWQEEVCKYLETHIEKSYAKRFRIGVQMAPLNPPIGLNSIPHQQLWFSIQAQQHHLRKFMEDFMVYERELILGKQYVRG